MSDCTHILGTSSAKVADKETGETITSWSWLQKTDDIQFDIETGYTNLTELDEVFSFCPTCGTKLPDLHFCIVDFSEDVKSPNVQQQTAGEDNE